MKETYTDKTAPSAASHEKTQLNEAREKINYIDREMAKLFAERMECVRAVAEYKMAHGLDIYDKGREDEIIQKNSMMITDGQLREYYVTFLKNNISVSRAYQERILMGMKVAYSGTEGAFAHIATTKLFPTARKNAYPDFEAAYRSVESGECDAAVLPLENSYNGEVGQVTDLIFSGSLYITKIIEMAVTQDLLAVEDATIQDIKEVLSHPQALGQCREYLREKGFIEREYSNTALAAKYVSESGSKSLAAIASGEAAEIFGLKILEKNINAQKTNTTKFAVLSKSQNIPSNKDMNIHTAFMFTVRNEAGALARAIDIIGKHGFNMRTIRSRPMKELLWQYYFYVEAEGNIHSPKGEDMLDELKEYCDKLKVVGTYIKE